MKVELCSFSGQKIYPAKGRLYVRLDNRVSVQFGVQSTPSNILQRSSGSPTESASHSSSNVRTQERLPGPHSAVSSTRRVLPRKSTRRRVRSPPRTHVVLSVSTLKLFKPREHKSQKSVLLPVKKPSSKLRRLRLQELTLPRLTLQSPLVQTRASKFWLCSKVIVPEKYA